MPDKTIKKMTMEEWHLQDIRLRTIESDIDMIKTMQARYNLDVENIHTAIKNIQNQEIDLLRNSLKKRELFRDKLMWIVIPIMATYVFDFARMVYDWWRISL